ncbi:adenylate kinase family protein [Aspergillus affinis]|uniref:adenylate kinase family protein n=1 Tax=Aspergillus affinis TaxID=1070780 RepID=UPI0022FEF9B4|nr:P-loop containing nucleoside triphosphate hydrolase protein [Aspergillus affinis]KAI9037023.1 P-loop containing nucleoside triphosphate hydrolase protein [Aspergillus affinis]
MTDELTNPGGPSVGKTTLAQHLARDLDMVHLQPDEMIRDLSRFGTASAFDGLRTAKDRKGQMSEIMTLLLLKMEIHDKLKDGRRVFLMDNFPKTMLQFYDFERQFGYQFTLRRNATCAGMASRFHNDPGTRIWEDYLRESTAFSNRDREFQRCSRFQTQAMRVEADHPFKKYYRQIRRVIRVFLNAPKVEPAP